MSRDPNHLATPHLGPLPTWSPCCHCLRRRRANGSALGGSCFDCAAVAATAAVVRWGHSRDGSSRSRGCSVSLCQCAPWCQCRHFFLVPWWIFQLLVVVNIRRGIWLDGWTFERETLHFCENCVGDQRGKWSDFKRRNPPVRWFRRCSVFCALCSAHCGPLQPPLCRLAPPSATSKF